MVQRPPERPRHESFGAVTGRLDVTGLFTRQFTDGFLREVADTAVFTAIEKHLAPREQVLGGAEESTIHGKITAAGAPGEVTQFLRSPSPFLGFAVFPDRTLLRHALLDGEVGVFHAERIEHFGLQKLGVGACRNTFPRDKRRRIGLRL